MEFVAWAALMAVLLWTASFVGSTTAQVSLYPVCFVVGFALGVWARKKG